VLVVACRGPLRPSVAQANDPGRLVIGVNRGLYGVELHQASLLFSCEFTTPFFEFLEIENDRLTALFETEVASITPGGVQRWHTNLPDVIVDWAIEGRRLSLHLMEDRPATLDIDSGELL
jgi:hypothetical protein